MYSTPLDEAEYDPILISFLSTVGGSLQGRAMKEGAILEQVLRRIVDKVYLQQGGDIDLSPLELKQLVARGLEENLERSLTVSSTLETPILPPPSSVQ